MLVFPASLGGLQRFISWTLKTLTGTFVFKIQVTSMLISILSHPLLTSWQLLTHHQGQPAHHRLGKQGEHAHRKGCRMSHTFGHSCTRGYWGWVYILLTNIFLHFFYSFLHCWVTFLQFSGELYRLCVKSMADYAIVMVKYSICLVF